MNHQILLLLVTHLCLIVVSVRGQIPITSPDTTATENFSIIGSSQNASLPCGWRADKSTANVRTIGIYFSADSVTDQRAGNSMGSGAANGIYNFGAGDPGTATDRAVGFLSTGSGTKSGNLYAWYVNETGNPISSFTVSYSVEKYRKGSNPAGFRIQLSYSTDGSSWTNAGAAFLTTFSPDADNGGFASAPGSFVPVNGTITVSIPQKGGFFLAWNYSVASGSTTSNAQALAIDDVSISATASGPLPTTVQFTTASSSCMEDAGTASIQVSISNPSPVNATNVAVALMGGNATNGSDIAPAFSTQTLNFPANSSADTSITVTIQDDSDCEGDETAQFELQNVSGGTNAAVGPIPAHTLTIVENDTLPDPSIVVNEYLNATGDITSTEAVELIVVKNGLDMRGFSLADGTSSGGYPSAILTFSNDSIWSSLPAGAIILIGGTNSIPAVDSIASDGLLLLRCPRASTSNRYFSSNAHVISISGSADVVAIRDASGSFIHGLAHGAAHLATLPFHRFGWKSGSLPTDQSLSFSKGVSAMTVKDFLSNACVGFRTPTCGGANDASGNLACLRNCRSRLITKGQSLAGTFYWDVTVAGGSVHSTGPVTIGNDLTIHQGAFYENGSGLKIDANGNTQNGTGRGSLAVGDGTGANAELALASEFLATPDSCDFDHANAIVRYYGASVQSILPATFRHLRFSNGNSANPKMFSGPTTVNGTLTIDANTSVLAPDSVLPELGNTASFINDGYFTGSLRAQRNLDSMNLEQNFGGIGLSLKPLSGILPGTTVVTMTTGKYLWIGNTPCISKSFTVSSANINDAPCEAAFRYSHADLNRQTESRLALKFLPASSSNWENISSVADTNRNEIRFSTNKIDGIITAHADPPQGVITSSAVQLAFEAEEEGDLPFPQTVTISNAYGEGSVIDWTATCSTIVTPSWLTLVPATQHGHNTGGIKVGITRTDLPSGVYTGFISVSDPHAANSPVTIPVSYRIYRRREICIGIDTIFIKATYKLSNPSKPVIVLNCGDSFGPGVIAWAAATGAPWLKITTANGVEGQSILLSANTQQRNPGTLYGSLTITGLNSVSHAPIWNSPKVIPVVLEIETQNNAQVSAGPMATGDVRLFMNPAGQRIARLRVTSGSITSFSLKLFPYQLPQGLTRLRYAQRYYQIEASGRYTAELMLFFTGNELQPMNITQPVQLRLYRQAAGRGSWSAINGSATPLLNAVTGAEISDLNGFWAMAMPLTGTIIKAKESLTVSDMADDRDKYGERSDTVPSRHCGDGMNSWETETDRECRQKQMRATEFSLGQNQPNPVSLSRHGSTTIRFTLPHASDITLRLADIAGKELHRISQSALGQGEHCVELPIHHLNCGIYFYQLEAGNKRLTRKLVVVR